MLAFENPSMIIRPSAESRSVYCKPGRRFGRMIFGVCSGLLAFAGETVFSAEPLTRIADIRLLPREKAGLGLPVIVRGVVTWRNEKENLTIQDDSAGIWISLVESRERGLWRGDDVILGKIREGMELEIEGRSDPGGYATLIIPETVRIIGKKPLPHRRS